MLSVEEEDLRMLPELMEEWAALAIKVNGLCSATEQAGMAVPFLPMPSVEWCLFYTQQSQVLQSCFEDVLVVWDSAQCCTCAFD